MVNKTTYSLSLIQKSILERPTFLGLDSDLPDTEIFKDINKGKSVGSARGAFEERRSSALVREGQGEGELLFGENKREKLGKSMLHKKKEKSNYRKPD